MYNDFIIVGPETDEAGIEGIKDAAVALAQIAEVKEPFVSRGDISGTHKKEMSLWAEAGVDPTAMSGSWYRETGSGMGKTLNIAAVMDAYTLTDRGPWISFGNRRQLTLLVEGDFDLFNPYGVILVNPERHPHVNVEAVRRFIEWITSEADQKAIAKYRLRGQQLFHPNAQ